MCISIYHQQVVMANCRNTRSREKTRLVKAEPDDPPERPSKKWSVPDKVDNLDVVVAEIKVSSVLIVKPQDGPKWYQAIFYAVLTNRKVTKCKTTAQVWTGQQCDTVTSTLRLIILDKVAETGINKMILSGNPTIFWLKFSESMALFRMSSSSSTAQGNTVKRPHSYRTPVKKIDHQG